ncbi:MAG TPA: histidine kinase [Polyangiaceae bacterium]|nr:histidine kinase [Polyangiaceae bacterium]
MRITRTMQILGYVLYAIAGSALLIDTGISVLHQRMWLAAYALFGLALHVGASVPSAPPFRRRRLGALAVMTPAMFAMAALMPCNFGALTLVIVASQAALVLTPRTAGAWALAQTMVISSCLIPTFGWVLGTAEIIALLGFQGFAVAAIASARGESEARIALARANADLLSARDDATRARERTRIARDLHDVLGHDLTALSLQLEIASHVREGGEDSARAQVAKARELTSRLLADVRGVVALMHTDPSRTLATTIRALVVEVPGLEIHLDVPESLAVEESRQAECVVRCVQEIVTNTRRHARGAENVWIRLRLEGDEITVEAHDDGSGAGTVRDGHGLRGMRSRLEELGGWLEVRTAPEHAFAISARLPLRAMAQ